MRLLLLIEKQKDGTKKMKRIMTARLKVKPKDKEEICTMCELPEGQKLDVDELMKQMITIKKKTK